MGSGIHYATQRPKTAKHLRNATKKHFKNESPESKAKYAAKINARRLRKQKAK
jgi:hypothetical protein